MRHLRLVSDDDSDDSDSGEPPARSRSQLWRAVLLTGAALPALSALALFLWAALLLFDLWRVS